MNWIEKLLRRFVPFKEIVNCDRDIYLVRWYLLRTKRVAIFLHKFVRSDEDRAVHDHPWNFFVLPLWRGYIEHGQITKCCPWCEPGDTYCECCDTRGWIPEPTRRRVYPIISARFRRAEFKHRVELFPCACSDYQPNPCCPKCNGSKCKPSWSLFFRFTERRNWGFWLPDGWTAWNKFWQDKCE